MENTTEEKDRDEYKPEEWTKIFKALNVEEAEEMVKALNVERAEELKNCLRDIAGNYRLMKGVEREFMPSRKAEREALEELANHVTAVMVHMEAIDTLFNGSKFNDKWVPVPRITAALHEQLGFFRVPELASEFKSLADRARDLAADIPKSGPTPKKIRYHLVWELASFFCEEVRRDPTLINEPDGRHSGDFYNFVIAVLNPLDPSACQGVAGEISKVLAELKGPTT